MREILFRGKRLDNGEWVWGDLIASNLISPDRNGELYINGKYVDGMVWGEGCFYRIDQSTIGQHTGLKDKNGERIFEGDVCRFREWSNGEMCWVGKVHWEHQQFMISGGPNKECETMFELCMSRFIPENIEVIGNIHDNPELIKEAQP